MLSAVNTTTFDSDDHTPTAPADTYTNRAGSARNGAPQPMLTFPEIIGSSPLLRKLLQSIETVAPTDASVLILGETGTGKELVAQAIHRLSGRAGRNFLKMNSAAIPAALLESELFGHERGAFTGAAGIRVGRFEMAHQGTLFLDEIGDMPIELQPKLLRVLQEQEFERLGSSRTQKVDVRVVTATHQDLLERVETGEFRRDLYYRLNVFPVRIPPLRERRDDIPLLANHFARKFAGKMRKEITSIPNETLNRLQDYDYPGNVRELENLVERGVILSNDGVLRIELSEPPATVPSMPWSWEVKTLEDFERRFILQTLESTAWRIGGVSGAAMRLGLNRTTLISKMRKLRISRATQQPSMA